MDYDEGMSDFGEDYDNPPTPIPQKQRGPGRPKKVDAMMPGEVLEQAPRQIPQKVVNKPEGYEAFHQQEVVGVRNVETGEIMAQGFSDTGTAMAFADLKNQLWKIEKALGSV